MLLFKKKKSFLTTKSNATKTRRPTLSKYPFLKSLKRRSNFRLQKLRISLMQRTLRYKLRRVNPLPVRSVRDLSGNSFTYGTKAQLSSYLGRRNIRSKQSFSRGVLNNSPYVARSNSKHPNLFFSFQRTTMPYKSMGLINTSKWSTPSHALWEALNSNSILKECQKPHKALTEAHPLLTSTKYLTSVPLTTSFESTLHTRLEEELHLQPNPVTRLELFESLAYENLNYSTPIYANLRNILGKFQALKLFNNRQKIKLRRKYVFASTWTTTFDTLDRFSYTRGVFLKEHILSSAKLTTQGSVIHGPKLALKALGYRRTHKSSSVNAAYAPQDRRTAFARYNKSILPQINSRARLTRAALLKKSLPLALSAYTSHRTVPKLLHRRHLLTQAWTRNTHKLLKHLRDSAGAITKLRRQYFRSRRRQRRFTFLVRRIKRQWLRRNRSLRFFYRVNRQLAKFLKTNRQKTMSTKKGLKWLPSSFSTAAVSSRLMLYPETSQSTFHLKPIQDPSSQRDLSKYRAFVNTSHFSLQLTISRLAFRSIVNLNYLSCEPLLRYLFSSYPLDVKSGSFNTKTKHFAYSGSNSLAAIVSIQNQLQTYFFKGHQPNLRLSNLWTAPTSHYTLRKRLLRFLSTASFQVEVTQWYYLTLTRFVEYCTGRKVALFFGPFVDDCLTFEERALSSTWLNRLMGFKKRLGHRIFIKESLSVILASFKLKDPTLLANWIRAMLKRISFWKYRLIFRFLKFLILHLLRPHFWKLNIRGFKLRLKGKISVAGNARTRTLFYRVGDTSHSKIQNRIAYDLSLVNTFTGVMGLKVWFIY